MGDSEDLADTRALRREVQTVWTVLLGAARLHNVLALDTSRARRYPPLGIYAQEMSP